MVTISTRMFSYKHRNRYRYIPSRIERNAQVEELLEGSGAAGSTRMTNKSRGKKKQTLALCGIYEFCNGYLACRLVCSFDLAIFLSLVFLPR